MRFGKTLHASLYPPWKDQYLDYAKLKSLLREDASRDDDKPWSEDDEAKFCEEMLNVQLEKVAAFQESTFKALEQRAAKASDALRDLAPEDGNVKGDITRSRFREIETGLDGITKDINELKRYSSINYTAFLKIVKKHDRKRGKRYKVRPMLQISLAKRPFNSEQGYTPLLNKLSTMYFIVRQNLEDRTDNRASSASDAESQTHNGERYTTYKFWVHPENILEVKTAILRRLPVLVYSQQSAKQTDTSQSDPTITSLYFDNAQFSLYAQKVNREVEASSLRLRWYGQLRERPEINLEQKIVHENGSSSHELRFPIKDKYIQSFIKGDYKMEKSVLKLERQHQTEATVEDFKHTASEIQEFIRKNDLQPVLRANYTRTAFQKPLDDRVRISIDTNLAFIREDTLDSDRPCRKPDEWHRSDIDANGMEYPFSNIHQGEISQFPFAELEIKIKEDESRKAPQWCQDLMSSHLVHKAPRFSKFVHGVASLFEDYVNRLPFWLSQLETDIRKDPQTAFEEEEQAKAAKAADDLMVGSYLGTSRGKVYKPAVSSPAGKSFLADRLEADSSKSRALSETGTNGKRRSVQTTDELNDEDHDNNSSHMGYGTLSSILPSFSLSRYAQARRQMKVELPPGVTKPGQLIKDSGPLHVEPKVWLANERTFLKWQHICILLGSLAITLYQAAGRDTIAELMGIAYLLVSIFSGVWGYYMHLTRRTMIVARSGKDFDNLIGPVIISVALIVALILNFIFQYRAALDRLNPRAVLSNATIVEPNSLWAEAVS
ncbi:MAG: Phosphate metabolism transcription protein [Claussenomyces sp. TS43310]|nr:MAG: Phosphate metabolism transcription protein [Claussenomyces sp. TS43310]